MAFSQTQGDTLRLRVEDLVKEEPQTELETFSRDIKSVVFVPRGQWITGVSVSYSQSDQNNYSFLILENLTGNTYSFKVSPMVGYAFRDDMAAGMKFAYSRSLARVRTADLVLNPETSFGTEYLYSLGHDYYGCGFLRNYFSLGESKRFGLFNEVQLQLGGGQSKLLKGTGEAESGSYETSFTFDVGLVPGLAIFLSDYSALEVNVGVLGFNYKATNTVRDQIYHSKRKGSLANFRINLFSVNFGVSFYL